MHATRLAWEAAGSPAPFETDGTLIPPRDTAKDAARDRKKLVKRIEEQRAAGDTATAWSLEQRLPAIVDDPVCGACGTPGARYHFTQCISDKFTTSNRKSRLWSWNVQHPDKASPYACAACCWAFKTIVLRCCTWFARVPGEGAGGGIWFSPMLPLPGVPGTRPRLLEALLNPPPPPFVACMPLAGIEKGGESNAHRGWLVAPPQYPYAELQSLVRETAAALSSVAPGSTAKEREAAAYLAIEQRGAPWLGAATMSRVQYLAWTKYLAFASHHADEKGALPGWWVVDPLVKLQSKHVLCVARVATSAARYPLQVDTEGEVMVDVKVWRRCLGIVQSLLEDLRALGIGARQAEAAMLSLTMPRLPMHGELAPAARALFASWAARTKPLRRHQAAAWWKLFVSLIPMPDLVPTPRAAPAQLSLITPKKDTSHP